MTEPKKADSVPPSKIPRTIGGFTWFILKEIISAYLSSPTPVLGLVLNQNYGYMMSSETVSFQERYNFDSAIWLDEHCQLCAKILGDSRRHLT